MESQEVQMQKRLDDMPKQYHKLYKKAMRGKSLRSAARAFCLECMAWQREEIKICTDLGCPFYPYRDLTSYGEGSIYYSRKLRESAKSKQPMLFHPPEKISS